MLDIKVELCSWENNLDMTFNSLFVAGGPTTTSLGGGFEIQSIGQGAAGVLFDMSFLEIGDIVLNVNNEWLYRSRKKSLEAKALDGVRGLLATVAGNRTAART